jgi:OmpA-OmpF porin, OOP family
MTTQRNTFTRKEIALAVACALALGVFSEIALAQAKGLDQQALLLDWRGVPVMSSSSLCVRTGFGPAPQWLRGCYAEVAAPLPVYEKVAFEATVLFDSDKTALRPAGRDTLDRFVASIHGLDSQRIVAIGYADRMGSYDSNQALSERRVDAVKAYLVGKGIKAERVQTSARGETRPSTFAGECKDANNAKNVACMQSDRHVFIEISGTRIAK